jgi:RNA polymerase sigma-70 factor, ECF subfamily
LLQLGVMLTPASIADGRLGELYRAHGLAIYHRCLRLLADRHAAEDATQETFLRVYRHMQRIPDPVEVLRWMYRIATNYCLNEIRRRRLRPIPMDIVPEPCAQSGVELRDRIAEKDAIRQITARVAEPLRQVAYLHHLCGLEQQEVADMLGISRRTVVYRLAAFNRCARQIVDPPSAGRRARAA